MHKGQEQTIILNSCKLQIKSRTDSVTVITAGAPECYDCDPQISLDQSSFKWSVVKWENILWRDELTFDIFLETMGAAFSSD